MKSLLIISLIALLGGFALTNPINKIPESDLEMGSLGPDDELGMSISNITGPETSTTTIGVGYLNFTYVSVKEYGNHPDARVVALSGGPGDNFVTLRFISGPSGNYNYTAKVWGVEFENNTGVVRHSFTSTQHV